MSDEYDSFMKYVALVFRFHTSVEHFNVSFKQIIDSFYLLVFSPFDFELVKCYSPRSSSYVSEAHNQIHPVSDYL
jgi:hypothetical protein